MKKTITLLLITITHLWGYSQFTKDDFLSNKKNVVFVGLDFSEARFIGSDGFKKPEEVDKLLDGGWNALIFKESEKKYNLKEALGADNYEFDAEITNSINKEIDAAERIIDKTYSLDKSKIDGLVKTYQIDKKEGVGVSFIIESFDKVKERAFVYLTFFDLETRKVNYTEKIEGKAGGFGYKNYWGNTIYEIIKAIDGEKKYKKLIYKKEIPMYLYGLDFTQTQFMGKDQFHYLNNIGAYFFDEWNQLLFKEKGKYNIGEFLGFKTWECNTTIVRANNDKINVKDIITDNDYKIKDENFQSIIDAYEIESQNGIGVTYVIESFNKLTEKATAYFVVFDLSTKKVLKSLKYEAEVGGFGLRNFWASGIHKMIEQLNKKHYKEELKSVEKLVFCGLDFSRARFIGSEEFKYLSEMESNFLKEWNVSFSENYKKASKIMGLENIEVKLDYTNVKNNIVVPEEMIIASPKDYKAKNGEVGEAMLSSYNFSDSQGIGLLYYVEKLDGFNLDSKVHFVVFDIKTKTVLIEEELSGKAKNGEFRKLWLKTLEDTDGDIKDKYETW